MPFEKGNTYGKAGKPKGVKNRVNRDIRQVFHEVYDQIGDHIINEKTGKPLTGLEAMVVWARDNPSEFYRLYAKMIPTTAELPSDGHEDFIDDLIFIDEQPKQVNAVDVTDVGNEDQKQLPSGVDNPQRVDDNAPPPKEDVDGV
jgi:hypothetical protein